MLRNNKGFSGFSVDDVSRAKKFYGDTLGLRVSEESGMLWVYIDGDNRVMAYPKSTHSPASFTILNFQVDDIDAAVDDLTSKGVAMERYADIETDEKGIYRNEGPPIAWFKDPAGNILSVLQE